MPTAPKRPSEMLSFYSGQVTIEKKPWGDHYRFIKVGTKGGLLSSTKCTRYLDKPALIGWAVQLVGTHITSTFQSRTGATFTKDEIMLVVGEAVLKPEEAKVKGGKTGDFIHDFAHDFALSKITGSPAPTIDHLDEEDPEHKKAINGINAFLDWYNTRGNKVKFLAMEIPTYYNSLFAGDSKPGEEVVEYIGIIDLVAEVRGKTGVWDYKTGKRIYSEQRYQLSSYRKGKLADGIDIPAPQVSGVLNFSKETGELNEVVIENGESDKDFGAFKGLWAVAKREAELDADYKNNK